MLRWLIPSRSPKYLEYFVFSVNSSNTTSNLLPVELTACTVASIPSNRKEIRHLIMVNCIVECSISGNANSALCEALGNVCNCQDVVLQGSTRFVDPAPSSSSFATTIRTSDYGNRILKPQRARINSKSPRGRLAYNQLSKQEDC